MSEIVHGHFSELKVMTFEIVRDCSVPSTMDEHRATLKDIMVKFYNTGAKEKILQASRQEEK